MANSTIYSIYNYTRTLLLKNVPLSSMKNILNIHYSWQGRCPLYNDNLSLDNTYGDLANIFKAFTYCRSLFGLLPKILLTGVFGKMLVHFLVHAIPFKFKLKIKFKNIEFQLHQYILCIKRVSLCIIVCTNYIFAFFQVALFQNSTNAIKVYRK